jgi:methyl-accepting chemotaxis protein
MAFLSKLKLSHMVMILALVPIITTVFFSAQIVIESTNKKKAIHDLSELTGLAVKMSNLVHEQQKERGATAVYLGSGGTKFSTELNEQRKQTDKKRSELKTFLNGFDALRYGQAYQKELQTVTLKTSKMDGIRKSVDTLSISAQQAIQYYTALNKMNLLLISAMSKLSPEPEIVSQIVSYANFLQAKEHSGIERAVGANGFAAGKFSPKSLNKFESLVSIQNTYDQVFLSNTTDKQKTAFEAVLSSPAAKEVQRMRNIVFAGGLDGNLENISGKRWFDASTKKINALKKFENLLSQNLLGELKALEKKAKSQQMQAILETLVALLFVTGLAFCIIRSISASIRNITVSMTELAKGNLDVELPPVHANEIGEMIKTVMVFKDNAIKKIELEAEQDAQKRRSEEEKRTMMVELADAFDTSVGAIVNNVSSASTELQSTAQSMSGIAQNTSSMSATVSAASEEAATNVQTVAAAAEEMSHSIAEINQQVSQASAAAKQAVTEVEKTGVQMEGLANTADSIGEVVQMISDIAEQTNLLALNATIESARAGEAGRGFAVVASEVKQLASQTGKATEGISAQVEEIQRATKAAVQAMNGIGSSIKAVDETSSAIAAAMEEQGAATQEIARNVQEAASGTEEVSRNIVGVNQASEESGAAAGEVTSAAGELSEQAEMLKGEVANFIQQVRAG